MDRGQRVPPAWAQVYTQGWPFSVSRKRRDSTAQGYPEMLRPALPASVQRRPVKSDCPGVAQGAAPRHPGVKDTVIKGGLKMKAAGAPFILPYIEIRLCRPLRGQAGNEAGTGNTSLQCSRRPEELITALLLWHTQALQLALDRRHEALWPEEVGIDIPLTR